MKKLILIFALAFCLMFSFNVLAFEKVDVSGSGFESEAVYSAKIIAFLAHANLAAASLNCIWVAENGNDTSGNGTAAVPYASLTKAMSMVTTVRKIIVMMPGVYKEVASVVWPTVTGIELTSFFGDVTIEGALDEDEVILIDPAAFTTSTFAASISNINISAPTEDEYTSGVDGITFDNTNFTNRKINLYLNNVSFEGEDADNCLYVVHTTAGQAMRVYWNGENTVVEGILKINPKNVDDRFIFTGLQFDSGITFGTATIASVTAFKDCILLEGGGLGGQDTQVLNVLSCFSRVVTTHVFAVASLNEFAANALENILP